MLDDENEYSASGKATWFVLVILAVSAVAFAIGGSYISPWLEARDYKRDVQKHMDSWQSAVQSYKRCLWGEPPTTFDARSVFARAANSPGFLERARACRGRLREDLGEPPPPMGGELSSLVESLYGAIDSLPPKNLYSRSELSDDFFEELCDRINEASASLFGIQAKLTGASQEEVAANCSISFEDAIPVAPKDLPDTVDASAPAAWRIFEDGGRLELQYNSGIIERSYWARTPDGLRWEIVIGPPDTPFAAAFARDEETLWAIAGHRVLRHSPSGWTDAFEIDETLEPASIHHLREENITLVIAWDPSGGQVVLRFEDGPEKQARTIAFQDGEDARAVSAAFAPTGEVFGVTLPNETSKRARLVISRLGLREKAPQRETIDLQTGPPLSRSNRLSPTFCFAEDRTWLLIDRALLTKTSKAPHWSLPALPEGFEPRFATCRNDSIALLGKADIERMPRRDAVSLCREGSCGAPFRASPFSALRAGLQWDRQGLELIFDDGQRWYQLVKDKNKNDFAVMSIKASSEGPLDHLVTRSGQKFYSLVSADNPLGGAEPEAVTSFPQTIVVSRTPKAP